MNVIVIVLLTLCFHQSFADDETILPDDDVEELPLSRNCLRCLCEMMGCLSDCDDNTNTCGVFHITLGYWAVAHHKDNNVTNTQAYKNCTKNAYCAVRTVQRYMRQKLPAIQTRRPDRLLCESAAALHILGPSRGHHELPARKHKKLYTCLHKRIGKWLEIDKA